MLGLRRSLESLAVRLACQRAHAHKREAMTDMVGLLGTSTFQLKEYADTVKGTHDLVVAGAQNDYLADAMAPLQGLSRRFWFAHVVDEDADIKTGSALRVAIIRAVLERDADAAQAASLELNDYLVDFSYASLRRDTAT